MADPYQRGSDADWMQAANDELAHIIKKRDRQIALLRLIAILLFLVLGWVLFKYSQKANLRELWPF